jgi:UDP-3-O-[3-hydroxymyristoyl] glucosamine N-acyltransferase
VAAAIGGEPEGDFDREISDVKPIEEAGPRDVTFIANPRYEPFLGKTEAACVVIPRGLQAPPGRTVIRHPNPHLAFAQLIALFRPPAPRPAPGVHPSAIVAPGARLGADVAVEAGAVIEEGAEIGEGAAIGALSYVGPGAKIGPETRLFPRVVLYHGVTVGARCIIHSGAVIGSDGFGFATDEKGRHVKIPQVGTVVIEDEVEIGANTTIDRAALGETRIGRGTKIDNLVMVAHNVEVGAGSILVAQSGISGSTKLGKHVIVAAQAGLTGHIEIGDRAVIAAQSGVTKDVAPGAQVLGSPAFPTPGSKLAYALIARLPEMKKAIAALEKRLADLEGAIGT